MPRARSGALAVLVLLSTAAAAPAAATEVSRTVTFGAAPAAVWQEVGPYCAIADWYPGIAACSEEVIGGTVNRRLTTDDGGVFLEKQLNHDDGAMRYSYAIVEGPLPVKDYESTFAVSEADGMTRVTWSSSFEPNGATEAEAADIIGGIYDTGLAAIKQRFAP